MYRCQLPFAHYKMCHKIFENGIRFIFHLFSSNTIVLNFLLFSPKQEYYQNFSTDTTEIESYLSKRLAEFLNVEIVLNTICDSSTSLKQWIRKTFFFVRTTKMMTPQKAEDHLNGMFIKKIKLFQNSKLWSNLTFLSRKNVKNEQIEIVCILMHKNWAIGRNCNRFKIDLEDTDCFCELPYAYDRCDSSSTFHYYIDLQCKVCASTTLSSSY